MVSIANSVQSTDMVRTGERPQARIAKDNHADAREPVESRVSLGSSRTSSATTYTRDSAKEEPSESAAERAAEAAAGTE